MKKLVFAVFAIVGATVISGCASLDERLASNDPRVKNEAERELVQSSREYGDEAARIAAVKRITNKNLLAEIAMQADSAQKIGRGKSMDTVKEGVVAVERIDDEKVFTSLAKAAKSQDVRLAAFRRIKNRAAYLDVACYATDTALSRLALSKVSSEDDYAYIAINATHFDVGVSAYEKIQDQQRLLAIALKSKNPQIVMNSLSRVADKAKLVPVVFTAKLAPRLVDAFIANCSDDALLAQIVKEHGTMLTGAQCAAIAGKSQSADLRKSIADLGDRKIEAEIKDYIQRKKDELRKKVEIAKQRGGYVDFSEYYHVDNADAQFFAKLLAEVNDTARLCDIVAKDLGGKGAGEFAKTLVSGLREDALVALLRAEGIDYEFRPAIMERIDSKDVLCKLAMNEEDATWMFKGRSVGERALEKIDDKATLVKIVLLAKNEVVSRQAEKKVNDPKAIIIGLTELLGSGKIDERAAESHVKALSDGEATVAMYNAAKSKALKELIFEKLSADDRKAVRQGSTAKCKKLIADAKGKASETFELGGFYLGMDIEDANLLIGYYFPDWSTGETVDSDEKDIRVVYVPQQNRPFCRADKDGKVWQFNFGKSILKKFYKYDVQNEREWAKAYSKEHGIDMKYVYLNEETTVADVSGSFDVSTYKAWLNQNTWQWKNNAKGYRLIYFAEPKIETAHGNIVRKQASYQFRFVSADAGTLRVTVDKD